MKLTCFSVEILLILIPLLNSVISSEPTQNALRLAPEPAEDNHQPENLKPNLFPRDISSFLPQLSSPQVQSFPSFGTPSFGPNSFGSNSFGPNSFPSSSNFPSFPSLSSPSNSPFSPPSYSSFDPFNGYASSFDPTHAASSSDIFGEPNELSRTLPFGIPSSSIPNLGGLSLSPFGSPLPNLSGLLAATPRQQRNAVFYGTPRRLPNNIALPLLQRYSRHATPLLIPRYSRQTAFYQPLIAELPYYYSPRIFQAPSGSLETGLETKESNH